MLHLEKILNYRSMSVSVLSKRAGLSYKTVSEIVKGKKRISNASAKTVYRLAKALDTDSDFLIEADTLQDNSESFEMFRSGVQHQLRRLGDSAFSDLLQKTGVIFQYWLIDDFERAFYLLALSDYLCRISRQNLLEGYDALRGGRLKERLYPRGALILDDMGIRKKETLLNNAIPEFLHYNIAEGDVRDVR